MGEPLLDRERARVATLKPYDEAKRLAPKLRELAGELRLQSRATARAATAQLRELEAEWATRAAELLRILAQEQWRQREAIKLYLHGREDRAFLRRVSETWNEDTPPTQSPDTSL
jgi:hypothetical protein